MTPHATRTALLTVLTAAAGCVQVASSDPIDTGDTGHVGSLDELPTDTGEDDYPWDLPDWAPRPPVPADNPMTPEKVALGRHLFHDTRLSGNETQSCGTCHQQDLGWSDGRKTSLGSTGEATDRNSMGLLNVAYMTSLNWANPTTLHLEQQIQIPLFGEAPIELGAGTDPSGILARLHDDPTYDQLFAAAFPDAEGDMTWDDVVDAIACFVRTMVSFDTPVDRSAYGGETLDAAAARGMELFFSERLDCHHCHGSWNFSLTATHRGDPFPQLGYQNNGLYNVDGEGRYPWNNTGLYAFTELPADMGRFRPPTLRHVAETGPYMHDGSVETLEEVIDIYARGGRLIEDGPLAGDGAVSPVKSTLVHGFTISEDEKADVVAFLEALTDETFLTDDRWSNPWPEDDTGTP